MRRAAAVGWCRPAGTRAVGGQPGLFVVGETTVGSFAGRGAGGGRKATVGMGSSLSGAGLGRVGYLRMTGYSLLVYSTWGMGILLEDVLCMQIFLARKKQRVNLLKT